MGFDITLLVGSCDSYSPLWENFYKCYKKYWQIDCPAIFVGETVPFNKPEFLDVLPGNLEWSNRILAGLEKVGTENVVFVLEDYWFNQAFDNQWLEDNLSLMNNYKASKILTDILYPPGVYDLSKITDTLYRFNNRTSQYLNSIQIGITKTEFLKETLLAGNNAWQYELDLNSRTAQMNKTILLNTEYGKMQFNAVRRGFVKSEGYEEFIQKENLC